MGSLAMPTWGTLADTEAFYRRESQRRADATANEWQRKIDYDAEIKHLLKNKQFYTGLNDTQRASKAHELLEWTANIANIGIGGRAIYNTALYGALGTQLAQLNEGSNVSIMWPFEEDDDRWGLLTMGKMFNTFSSVPFKLPDPLAFPCVYPDKSRRQPLSL